MLCRDDNSPASCRFQFFAPIIGINMFDFKFVKRDIAAAPFFFCKSVKPEMNEIIITEFKMI